MIIPEQQKPTRVNKISSTFTVFDSATDKPVQSSTLSCRPNHRKYKLSHSQITKIDKLSKQGLMRWKQSREGENDGNYNKHLGQNSNMNKCSDRISQKGLKIGSTSRKEKQKHRTTAAEFQFIHANDQQQYIREDTQTKPTQPTHHHQLHQIQQATTSVHSINYKLKKDKLLPLSNDLTLHVQIITFDLNINRNYYNQQQLVSEKEGRGENVVQVICFQVHDKKINMHYRSEFTYKTLGQEVRFVFEDIEELFAFVVGYMDYNNQQKQQPQPNSIKPPTTTFNRPTMQLQLSINLHYSHSSSRPKTLKIPLLPFAVIQIVQHHDHHQQDEQKKILLQQISELKHDLEVEKTLVHALRDENDKLKARAKRQEMELERERVEKEVMMENYVERLSRVSDAAIKEYQFEFIPDQKTKNSNHFQFKANILKKVKNDLKWDQVSSQAPLPKAGRHYFSFLIKNFLPDFMFGIVTLKGKDTSNAFLGLQTICLYASKNNCYIYQRGKHYKISVTVKRGDTVFVIVDREKGVIEWVKRKGDKGSMVEGKERVVEGEQRQEVGNNQSFVSMTPFTTHTQDDLTTPTPHPHRPRKASQTLTSSQLPSNNHLSTISLIPLTTAIDYPPTQIDYIHSTTIPEQMSTRQLFAYLEVYNVNQPLKLNEKK